MSGIFRRLIRCGVGVAAALLLAPWALAYPAHYFVVEEAADGRLGVVFHQLVNISGTPGPTAPAVKPGSLESQVSAVVREKISGRTSFNSVATGSPWLRGEFHGPGRIDGRALPLAQRLYVVRVPVQAGTVLRLAGDRGPGDPIPLTGQPAATAGIPGAALEIDLDQYHSLAQAAPPPLPPGAATGSLIQTGQPGNRLDLLVVAEGYTAAQQDQFIDQMTALVELFQSISPYRDFSHLMNVHWLFVPSNQSGADKPACPETPNAPVVSVDTAFDARFCTSGIRRLVTVNAAKVLAAAAAVPDWDKVLVLVNDGEYGGSGGSMSVATTDSASAEIMQHEFGHSFTLLADEYDAPFPGYPPCSDLTSFSPCEANVTDQADRSKLKWKGWVAAQTPVPTTSPLADPIAAGLWEGARYLSAGMYRQCFDGIMRALGGRPFCHVDSEAFVKRLYGGGWGVPAQGVSLIEPGAIPSGASVSAPVQSEVQFQATLAGSLSVSGLTATWMVDGIVTRAVTSAHGAQQSFGYTVPDTGTHTVELRVSDSTPLMLIPPSRSRIWTVQALPVGPVVFEFYNTTLDNYFITAYANEAAAIDNGSAGPGWTRTGGTFKSGGSTPVCRFYGSQSPGPNSHFYTVSADECQFLKSIQFSVGDPRRLTIKSWNFEGIDFVSSPPTGGQCPAGTVPVRRAYNNGFARGVDSNHRITTNPAAIAEVVGRGWLDEGIVMCSPV